MLDDLLDLFRQQEEEFPDTDLAGATCPDDILSIFEKYEDATNKEKPTNSYIPFDKGNFVTYTRNIDQEINAVSIPSGVGDEGEEEAERARKKLKVSPQLPATTAEDVSQKMSHIIVERDRSKKMNENLSVLGSLMPSIYVKSGDQASVIGGVIDYVKELQQVLKSLEAKKQRKLAYSTTQVLISPRSTVLSCSLRPSPLSARTVLPASPRKALLPPQPHITSPMTPQPGSPYKPRLMQRSSFILLFQEALLEPPQLNISTTQDHHQTPPESGGGGGLDQLPAAAAINIARSPAAEVEVKLSGPNVLLKTFSRRIPWQALKLIAALDGLALEIQHLSIKTIDDDTLLNSFTIKIGIECRLSAEELAQEIHQTFSSA